MIPSEIEVKFYITDKENMRQRILDIGAQSKGLFFETNIRYEDDKRSLRKHKALLRLRKDVKTTLTYKISPSRRDPNYKVFSELEVEVSNFTRMNQILNALGFHSEQTYEKWRETFVLARTQFCLDAMPFGCFLEIEGSKEDIRHFSTCLGLVWPKRIVKNYLELFEILRKKLNLPFYDLTFDNFKPLSIDASLFMHLFEVGHS